MANALMVIHPYRWEGMWVFDDEAVDLVKEPFVAGADDIIDQALLLKKINDAENGFRLIFSAGEFPGHDVCFEWIREGDGGNWYQSKDFAIEGWLCPALFKYFDKAPETIYAKFEAKN